jgi:hypothetical protein
MKTLRLTPLFALLICLCCAAAASADVTKEVGYMDLEWIVIPDDATEIKDIDLGPILGDIAKDAEANGDDALVQALAMVRSIRVKAYSLEDGGAAEAQASVDKVTQKMKSDDWKRLIYMKDGEETVSVNTRYDGEDLVGLMIIMYEADDSVAFVNVVGDLNLGTLLSLAKQIDGDSLEDMLEDLDGVHGIEIDHDDHDHDHEDG